MTKGRLETFTDGVIAIILTIMVLELHVPEAATFEALRPLVPVFLSYVLSFLVLGTYWNNHHHVFAGADRVSGGVMWANLHLLFWLSLIPFVTSWMGERSFAAVPVAAYGVVLGCAGMAFYIMVRQLVALHGPDSVLARAFKGDWKSPLSLLLYTAGIAVSFFEPLLGFALYWSTNAIWLVPDRRVERARG